ncbi:MAG: hypothetical protein CMF59_11630 [Leptospiraceae bacterium]|nr:hypothetical protein [Leptospiraceae bacterium]
MYAARAAANCTGPSIGDGLLAIVLGDHPDVQEAALISLETHLHPGYLPALVEFGKSIQPVDSAYLMQEREPMPDLPRASWQKKKQVYRYIHAVLEKERKSSGESRGMRSKDFQQKLVLFLKQGLYESRSGMRLYFSESRDVACYNLDSLAMVGESPNYILEFVESEADNPGILACGLYAMARFRMNHDTGEYNRTEALASRALKGDQLTRKAARQWYAGQPELGSLTRLMRSFRKILPFNEPEIRTLARALPGTQGLINRKAPMYANPFSSGPVIRVLSHGEAVDVLRRSTGYDPAGPGDGYSYLVKTEDGLTGWVASEHLITESKKN